MEAAQPQYLSLSYGGLERTFILYVPEQLSAAPCPLVFMLHGGGGDAAGVMTNVTEYRWNGLADSHRFMVAIRMACRTGGTIAGGMRATNHSRMTSDSYRR